MTRHNAIEKSTQQDIAVSTPSNADRNGTVTTHRWTYRPDVDVIERDDAFEIIADMPGASRESIDVTIEERTLLLSARVPTRVPQGASFLAQEYGVGDYHRRFEFNTNIDCDRIEAFYTDGVLRLVCPKAPESVRRRIDVQTS